MAIFRLQTFAAAALVAAGWTTACKPRSRSQLSQQGMAQRTDLCSVDPSSYLVNRLTNAPRHIEFEGSAGLETFDTYRDFLRVITLHEEVLVDTPILIGQTPLPSRPASDNAVPEWTLIALPEQQLLFLFDKNKQERYRISHLTVRRMHFDGLGNSVWMLTGMEGDEWVFLNLGALKSDSGQRFQRVDAAFKDLVKTRDTAIGSEHRGSWGNGVSFRWNPTNTAKALGVSVARVEITPTNTGKGLWFRTINAPILNNFQSSDPEIFSSPSAPAVNVAGQLVAGTKADGFVSGIAQANLGESTGEYGIAKALNASLDVLRKHAGGSGRRESRPYVPAEIRTAAVPEGFGNEALIYSAEACPIDLPQSGCLPVFGFHSLKTRQTLQIGLVGFGISSLPSAVATSGIAEFKIPVSDEKSVTLKFPHRIAFALDGVVHIAQFLQPQFAQGQIVGIHYALLKSFGFAGLSIDSIQFEGPSQRRRVVIGTRSSGAPRTEPLSFFVLRTDLALGPLVIGQHGPRRQGDTFWKDSLVSKPQVSGPPNKDLFQSAVYAASFDQRAHHERDGSCVFAYTGGSDGRILRWNLPEVGTLGQSQGMSTEMKIGFTEVLGPDNGPAHQGIITSLKVPGLSIRVTDNPQESRYFVSTATDGRARLWAWDDPQFVKELYPRSVLPEAAEPSGEQEPAAEMPEVAATSDGMMLQGEAKGPALPPLSTVAFTGNLDAVVVVPLGGSPEFVPLIESGHPYQWEKEAQATLFSNTKNPAIISTVEPILSLGRMLRNPNLSDRQTDAINQVFVGTRDHGGITVNLINPRGAVRLKGEAGGIADSDGTSQGDVMVVANGSYIQRVLTPTGVEAAALGCPGRPPVVSLEAKARLTGIRALTMEFGLNSDSPDRDRNSSAYVAIDTSGNLYQSRLFGICDKTDPSQGEQILLPVIYESPFTLTSLDVSPDGRYAITGTTDGKVLLWFLGKDVQALGSSAIDKDLLPD